MTSMNFEKIEDIDWTRTNPCPDCPFMKSAKWHSGIADSIGSYETSVEAGAFTHTCHKTDNRPECDGAKGSYKGEKPQHCAGAFRMILRSPNIPFQIHFLKAFDKGLGGENFMAKWKKWEKDKSALTWDEMKDFYTGGLQFAIYNAFKKRDEPK